MPTPIPFATYRAKLGRCTPHPHHASLLPGCSCLPRSCCCPCWRSSKRRSGSFGCASRTNPALSSYWWGPTLPPALHLRRPPYDGCMLTNIFDSAHPAAAGAQEVRCSPRCLASSDDRQASSLRRCRHLAGGCMADAGNPDQATVPGYRYHDANHTNVPSGNASPQAIYNATHGTWLWPPAENDKPNG